MLATEIPLNDLLYDVGLVITPAHHVDRVRTLRRKRWDMGAVREVGRRPRA
jgi:hypothetical protein